MSNVPTLGDTDGVRETVVENAKRLCPWLPDPYRCECGAYCEATVAYDARLVDYVDAWRCPDCGSAFYREGY